MAHSVRNTLLWLGLGTIGQRLLQLAAFAVIGRTLGLQQLGVYAQGLAAAGMLAVLAGAGVRNLLAREVARSPQRARSLVRQAVAARCRNTLVLLVPALAWAWLGSAAPWFWTLSLVAALPAACDGKGLLDATGLARREVVLETTAALVQFAGVLWWAVAGDRELSVLAAIALGSRAWYALGVLAVVAKLPGDGLPAGLQLPRTTSLMAAGQAAHELVLAGEVWFVAQWFGPVAAGAYALAQRLGAAALVPAAQLARLLLPHLLRAPVGGDSAATTRAALRATAFAVLPVVAGGAVVAGPLCRWFGPEHAAAAAVLRWWLLGSGMMHLGWQCSHALLADRRDRAYALGLLLPALGQVCLWAMLAGDGAPLRAAVGSAAAQAVYLAIGLLWMTRAVRREWRRWLGAPLGAALATAAAAALPLLEPGLEERAALLSQLVLGGLGGAAVVWWCELRGRWRRFGGGLVGASGFGA